jgi:nicotinate-nucleotide pyrophosphorylase (carboxylating)
MFTPSARHAAETLIQSALAEDLGTKGDLTCQALISPQQRATVSVVARQTGVLAGEPVGRMVMQRLDAEIEWSPRKSDGDALAPNDLIADVTGPLAQLLIGERTMLNFLTHLSGIATLTRKFVDAVAGTQAKILDTRKTLPGWRALEKYAVRCGGGVNHRMGLYDGVLIKDNHLSAWTESNSLAAAVDAARRMWPGVPIEIEVDTLEQLAMSLAGSPSIVLLDNMSPALLSQAVELRNRQAPQVLLEASGGITLANVAEVALTGVERISIGALTHSAPALDLALDWKRSLEFSRESPKRS